MINHNRYTTLRLARNFAIQKLGGKNLRIKSVCETQCAEAGHPALKRQDRLGKEPFAGFGTVVEDITESGYTKNQPILLGAF